jgi:lipid-A-disaccharide synthase-like uncharacterized protein
MDYAALAVLICGVMFYTRGAAMEKKPPFIWGSLSVGVSLLAMFIFKGGWLSVLFSQMGLFVAITLFRVITEKDDNQ